MDTMIISGNTVMAIKVDAGEAFDATGHWHYPVLAGFDSDTGEPLYIAVERSSSYGDIPLFTCIRNGASHATFINSVGELETVDEFYVLVLRHDPVNSKPNVIPKGAMDSTGPIFWLNYWPKRDPSIPNDPTFERIDQYLERILKMITGRTKDGHFGGERALQPCSPVEDRGSRNTDNNGNEVSWELTSDKPEQAEILSNMQVVRAIVRPTRTLTQLAGVETRAHTAAVSGITTHTESTIIPELTAEERLHRLEEENRKLREENKHLRARPVMRGWCDLHGMSNLSQLWSNVIDWVAPDAGGWILTLCIVLLCCFRLFLSFSIASFV